MVLAYGFPFSNLSLRRIVRGTFGNYHDVHPQRSEPHVLDQPWPIWSTIAVMGILLAGILLGVMVIPIVQGRNAGLIHTRSAERSNASGSPPAAARGQDAPYACLAGGMDARCLANPRAW